MKDKDIQNSEQLISSIDITNNFISYIKTQFLYAINVLKILQNFLVKNNHLNFKILTSELKNLKKLLKKLNKYLLLIHIEDLKINDKLALSFVQLVENYLLLFDDLRQIFKTRDFFDNWLISNTNCLVDFQTQNKSKKIQTKKISLLFWRGNKLLRYFEFNIDKIRLKLIKIKEYLNEN